MQHKAVGLAALGLLLSSWAVAEAPPPVDFVRGVVTAITDTTLTLNAGDNANTLSLDKGWTVSVLKPIAVSKIKAGSFIGTAEMPQADGTGRSIEVHVFPPGVKAGEGHYGWNLREGAMMTNGTVDNVVVSAKGRELDVTYGTDKRRIVVPKKIPVVEITPGKREQVKVGLPVFAIVAKKPDGSALVVSVSIGVHGAKPPM